MSDFDGMGEAVAEMVGNSGGEYLGLGFESSEGAGINDARPIALEYVTIAMVRLRIAATPALGGGKT